MPTEDEKPKKEQKFVGKDVSEYAVTDKAIERYENAKKGGFFDALATIRPADFTEVHLKPCVREGYLFGMGSGFAVGFLRAVVGGRCIDRSGDLTDSGSVRVGVLQLGRRLILCGIIPLV